MRISNFKFLMIVGLAITSSIFVGCNGASKNPTNNDPNETAATVNGTPIKMADVEIAIKQQAPGQESKLSQLELAQMRLQVLDQLIQQEVLYQKAEAEKTMPTDDEITAEINKLKTQSGVSQEEFNKKMTEAGMNEDTLRDNVKKSLAIQKLIEKVAGKVEPPKESEIEAYYNGNKEAFVKKRGVRLAAIVVDPTNAGNGDATTDEASTNLKVGEIQKKLQSGADFATLASTESEDPSKLRKGDLGYVTEEQLVQMFSPQVANQFMSPEFQVGQITSPMMVQGKVYIFKLQERNEKEEALTLNSPGVKEQITEYLSNARKQLLQASYAAVAMNEAKIVNQLAQRVVDNPNELSGARPAQPAGQATPAAAPAANTGAAANTAGAKPPQGQESPAKEESKKPTEGAANSEQKK